MLRKYEVWFANPDKRVMGYDLFTVMKLRVDSQVKFTLINSIYNFIAVPALHLNNNIRIY